MAVDFDFGLAGVEILLFVADGDDIGLLVLVTTRGCGLGEWSTLDL